MAASRPGSSSASSTRRTAAWAGSYRGIATPRASASARYASTIRNGMNSPGIGGPSWKRRRVSATGERVGTMDGLDADRRAVDEPRDQIAGTDERDHLRPDADPGGGHGRGVLDLRLMPSRWVSFPARRSTQRSVRRRADTTKFRFVMPPLNGRRVSSSPASSGTRCIAATSESRTPWITSPIGLVVTVAPDRRGRPDHSPRRRGLLES